MQIGAGESVNAANGAAPININYRSLRGQMVYTAQELNDAGFNGPGLITQLGFFVQSPPIHPLPSFMIRMKHTTASDASSHDPGPYQTVLLLSSYAPSANSWNMLNLSEHFYWNGIDNILVDTVFNRVPSFNTSGQQRIFDSPTGLRFARSDSFNQTNATTFMTVNYKPQIRLKFANAPLPEPQNLTGEIIDAGVVLNWDASTAYGYSTPQPDFYGVYRNGELLSDEVTETSFFDQDAGMQYGIVHTYYITAIYQQGESVPSNSFTAQLLPPTPVNLNISIANNTLSISWLTIPGIEQYKVEAATNMTGVFEDVGNTLGEFTVQQNRTVWLAPLNYLSSSNMMFFRVRSVINPN